MKKLNSGGASLAEEVNSDQSSNSTDYGLQHAEDMMRDTGVIDASEAPLSVDDSNSLNSRTDELLDNQSLNELPHVSEAVTERDSDEDISLLDNSEKEVKGRLKV